jgi:hypothetical protein
MSNEIKPGEQLTLAQINRLRKQPSAPAVPERSGEKAGWNIPGDDLRKDGPTVSEFVEAGYLATNYPPFGYASRSTDYEIAKAIADQAGGGDDDETDPLKMKVPALKAWLTEKGIKFESSDKKEDLQALVPKEQG